MKQRRLTNLLLLFACFATLVAIGASGCSRSKKPKFAKDAQGRTILMSDVDVEPVEEQRQRKSQDVLLTKADDARVGEESAKAVEAQMGVIDDPVLTEYVQGIGDKLLRGVPRSFEYRFRVVDQVESNAFALPGGYIFVSRGLLALAANEDELANVIGHEITHSARRHAARGQAAARYQSRLAMPWVRAKESASYSRDMEREADRGGQMLAAAAGYDPMGMSTFMASLQKTERLTRGYSRPNSFFDTHPGTRERVGANAVRAREIRWVRDPELGDVRLRYLEHIEGLPLGERPESGIFVGNRFIHPELDFTMSFPEGWQTANTAAAVGAATRNAQIFLEIDSPPGDARDAVDRYLADLEADGVQGLEVKSLERAKIAGGDGVRVEFEVPGGGGKVYAMVTFFPWKASTWRITGVSPARVVKEYRGRLLSTTRSFRPLPPELRQGIMETRLRLVEARNGEDISSLCQRTSCAWAASQTAIMNEIGATHVFGGGEVVKIAHEEAWEPAE